MGCLNNFLQGIFLTLRAAQAGLTPALGLKVGPCFKIPHPKVQKLTVNATLFIEPVLNHLKQ